MGVAAGVVLAPSLRVDAAKPSARLDVTFGPVVVEARTGSQAFVSIRNTGTGAAKLGLGDTISVSYGLGAAPDALAATGSRLAVAPAPPGTLQSDPSDPSPSRAVARLVVQSRVTIAPGSTLLLPFDFVAGPEGVASVVVNLKLAKSAGKYPPRIETRVAKSHPRDDVFYGDGSAGPLTLTSSQAFPQIGNWTDVLIDTGTTVTVPAGATIRCTGTFENRGTIVVLPGASGGGERIDNPSGPIDPTKQFAPALRETGVGDALGAPSRPSVMQAQASSGGLGGVGLGSAVYQLPLSHYRRGGSGGSGALGAVGGDGGGVVRIVARGEIVNSGTISAAGSPSLANRTGTAVGGGGGGGAGGVVILASAAKVTHTGTIDVRGANGGGPDLFGASGGGGGGGLIVFAAPLAPAGGTLQFGGGSTPTPSGMAGLALWAGGGGGGACVGDGGDGFGVGTTGVLGVVDDGQGGTVTPRAPGAGQVIVLTVDPRTVW